MVLASFEPVLRCSGPPNIRRSIENGAGLVPKDGQKMIKDVLSKGAPGTLGMLKQGFLAYLEPVLSCSAPCMDTSKGKSLQSGERGVEWREHVHMVFANPAPIRAPRGPNSTYMPSVPHSAALCTLKAFISVWENGVSSPSLAEESLLPPSQVASLRVYNMPTVPTNSRLHLIGAGSVYRLQTAIPMLHG